MAELPTINLALYAQTDVGMVRSGNEDNFLILDLSTGRSWTASEEEPPDLLTYAQGYYGSLLAVSDGMGGALAGEVASRMAVETVRDRMLQLQAHEVYSRLPFHERLRLSIEEANILINGESQTNPAHKGLGATFTAVATLGNQVFFGQVGDSRAYLIRGNNIVRTTKDQSLVQQLIDAGQITEEEAETHSYRNVILQALGAHSNVNVEVGCLALCNMDTLVICSDGLSGKVHQDEIARIIHESRDFKSACQHLINLANERGGEDNITVVIAQFSGSGLALPESEQLEPQSLARSPDTPTEVNWGGGAGEDHLIAPTAPVNAISNVANHAFHDKSRPRHDRALARH
jgi:PPM family protein phosphatase